MEPETNFQSQTVESSVPQPLHVKHPLAMTSVSAFLREFLLLLTLGRLSLPPVAVAVICVPPSLSLLDAFHPSSPPPCSWSSADSVRVPCVTLSGGSRGSSWDSVGEVDGGHRDVLASTLACPSPTAPPRAAPCPAGSAHGQCPASQNACPR